MEELQKKRLHDEITNATVKIWIGESFKGSGFFISPEGYVLTAYHCIGAHAPKIWVETRFDGKYLAQLEEDKSLKALQYDVAVLRIFNHQPSHYVPLGFISREHINDEVVAIGYPASYYRLYTGKISGVDDTTFDSDVIKGEGQSGGSVYHYRTQRVVGLASTIWKREVIVNEGSAVRFKALFTKWGELEETNQKVVVEWEKRLQRLSRQPPSNVGTQKLEKREQDEIFTFDVVLVDSKGKEISRKSHQNRQKAVDLGKGVKLEVAHVPEGKLMVGVKEGEEGAGSDEYPQHQVIITTPFWMGKYPVTVGQFKRFVEETGYQTEAETGGGAYVWVDGDWGKKKNASWKNPYFKQTDKCPVVCVSWNDAQQFIAWLNQKQKGYIFRLPSEAEWEYACRAGTTAPFHCGETITPNLVNYNGNYPYGDVPEGEYRQKTVEVDYFKHANYFGLYQMHGNVWEWCEDVWHENYEGAPTDGSAWVVGGNQDKRTLRGGSWNSGAFYCRVAYRFNDAPSDRDDDFGFRVVLH